MKALFVAGSWFFAPQRAYPVGGGVLVVIGDAGLKTSFPWVKPMGGRVDLFFGFRQSGAKHNEELRTRNYDRGLSFHLDPCGE